MTPASTFAIANTFRVAYERCRGSGAPADQGIPNAIIPSIVCLAFAIEVGLKSILNASSSATSGHRLDKLFNGLAEADRLRIIIESGVEAESFRQNLEAVSNSFVEWRYIYEHRGIKSISEEFLLMLWSAIENVALEKIKEQRANIKRDV